MSETDAALPQLIATVDHVIPYRDGGPPVLENLRLSCPPCNWLRDVLLTADCPDPRGRQIVSVYAATLLLLSPVPQGRGKLATAGLAWRSVAPALEWLIGGGLAARAGDVPQWQQWHATQTGLVLARTVRAGVRDRRWLRAVLGDPGRVARAHCSALPGDPVILARHVDGSGPGGNPAALDGTLECSCFPALGRPA